MTYNRQKQSRILEFDKITAMLAEKCSSAEARETALSLLPCGDYETGKMMILQTKDAYEMSLKLGAPSFYGLSMRADLLRRAAAGGSLSIRELLLISASMRVVRTLITYRRNCGEEETVLDRLFSSLTGHKDIEDRIENSIANEETLSDSASPTLANIRRKMRAAQDSARTRLNGIITSSGNSKYLQEQVIMMRDGRFVVPVKVECRSNIPGLVHGVSASGATLFVEPASVVEANNEVRILESKEQIEIERILAELSSLCGDCADDLIQSCEAAVKLEVIFAKSELGIAMNGYLPDYGDDGIIDIKKARHPLIDKKQVVPVDVRLGDDFDTLVITGPNTGGKTVVLKTVGLFCMMASCGMMLPAAEHSRVSWFDKILADIGDEQSIEQSLSTFSAHTTNIVSILEQATHESLVLLDELGAGTDPAEGAALAVSILEDLRKKGAKIVATTHYAELKQYAITNPGVTNGCCEFDVATLKPTYKLLIGVPGSSNAFAISTRLGVGDSIIERAKEVMDKKTLELDKVMRQLESERQKLENDSEEMSRLRREAEVEKQNHDRALKKAQSDFDKEIERQRADQLRIIQSLRFEYDRLMKEIEAIRKEDKSKPDEMARRAKAEIAGQIKKMEQVADPVQKPRYEENYTLPRPLVVGDLVYLPDFDKNGTVIEIGEGKGKLTVDIGMGKVKVAKSRVRLADKKAAKKKDDGHVSFSGISRADRAVETSVMIRHMELVEAMPVVEQFLDDAVINHLSTVTIIHGKGTGTLRRAAHALLKDHPNVKSFRLGKYGEGEDGVTVVELK
ncbi:MAG TPA: endonuclease MutS2 [Oscillospiraceae bacterium]|nr:endonuclease MutS2 [Oscillospiraceae bacterium]HPF56206.1 endonuclease MutS2 [Clostridiales bacterium]HPK36633.1 endonuclease MutS2 [Oscillospiraceae bacterium]HPR76835.1 endonuclease MutS2 [Oscillospiraceae bacterium]